MAIPDPLPCTLYQPVGKILVKVFAWHWGDAAEGRILASPQERNGSYRVLFCHNGKLHSFTIGKVKKDEAENKARQIDYLLMRLKQRLLVLLEGIDIVTFVEHDGNPPDAGPTLPEAPRQVVTLSRLKERYLDTHGNGTIEANSLDTARLHLNHFGRVLGDGLPLGELNLGKLQEYVNNRSKDKTAPTTIRKEVATLRGAWNWGEAMGLTDGRFPNRGLRYPKADEKPPFMTMEEIKRQVAAGGPGTLWECLYLQASELNELLTSVKANAAHPWIHPLFCFAAHTGARRSELLRALVADVDFAANIVTVHEKKRSRGQRTSRRVPLTPFLRGVLEEWLKEHPGGPALFCHCGEVARSKKRSRTTGHQNERKRPSSLKDRLATVKKREKPPQEALTRNEVHDHLRRVLAGTKWEHLRGLHTLRHSFVSACASRGIDQRLVQEWCGHMNEETSRRYRHLWPSTQQEAIKRVFE
jgi:integrase